MTEDELSNIVIGLVIKVHKNLNPGLLESSYKECLYYEINKARLHVEKEKPMPLIYEEVKLDIGYWLDIIVENKLVIEIKSVEVLNDVHLAQTLTYLRLFKLTALPSKELKPLKFRMISLTTSKRVCCKS